MWVALVTGQYRQQPCSQHIEFAVRIRAGVDQRATVDPGVVDASGRQNLAEESQLRIRCGTRTVVLLHVHSSTRGIHHHDIRALRLHSNLPPFCLTHLVTSLIPVKRPNRLPCGRFMSCQLP